MARILRTESKDSDPWSTAVGYNGLTCRDRGGMEKKVGNKKTTDFQSSIFTSQPFLLSLLSPGPSNRVFEPALANIQAFQGPSATDRLQATNPEKFECVKKARTPANLIFDRRKLLPANCLSQIMFSSTLFGIGISAFLD